MKNNSFVSFLSVNSKIRVDLRLNHRQALLMRCYHVSHWTGTLLSWRRREQRRTDVISEVLARMRHDYLLNYCSMPPSHAASIIHTVSHLYVSYLTMYGRRDNARNARGDLLPVLLSCWLLKILCTSEWLFSLFYSVYANFESPFVKFYRIHIFTIYCPTDSTKIGLDVRVQTKETMVQDSFREE